jgi:hypothetical protein
VKSKLLLAFVCAGAGIVQAAGVDVYSQAIQQLGGVPVSVASYPRTVAGFAAYLKASGVSGVSAQELTTPNHPEVAARLGFQTFLPPQEWWPRGACLGLLAQAIRTKTVGPVHLRNWWRPAAYNVDPRVGGAKNGDHPTANALDLDYASVADRMHAETFLRDLHARFPWMGLSLGLGAQTTHVGIGSPRGHREWHYAGYAPPRPESLAVTSSD